MPVYLDVETRADIAAAEKAAQAIKAKFLAAGDDISKSFGSKLSGAFNVIDGSRARAEIQSVQDAYARAAAAEADAARAMVRSTGEVEVATRRAAEMTAKYGDASSQAARGQMLLADAQAKSAIATNAHIDSMVASEAAAAKMATAQKDAATASSNAWRAFNTVGITATAGLGLAMAETTKKAGDFEASQTKLVAAADEKADKLKIVSDGILKMAGDVGYSAQELSNGMYIVEKAGYRAEEGLKVLRTGAQLASIEQADMKEVLVGLTTTMRDFNIPTDQAAVVASKLKVAVGDAKTNLQEFSGALHNIEPVAALAHLSIEEVYGSLARLTQSGTSPDQASQNLAQTVRNFMGPNQQMRDALGKIGLSASELQAQLGDKKVGLSGVLQEISTAIRDHVGPDGKVVIDTFYQNADAARAVQTEYDGLSDKAKRYADQLKSGEIDAQKFKKGIKSIFGDQTSAQDFSRLNQWFNQFEKLVGFSSNLKKMQPSLETVQQLWKETTGGAETLNVAAQLAGSPEAIKETNQELEKLGKVTATAKGDVQGLDESSETLNYKMRQAKSAFGAAAIEIGTLFVPVMKDVATVVKAVGDFLAEHKGIAEGVAWALTGVAGAWLAVKAAMVTKEVLHGVGTTLEFIGKLNLGPKLGEYATGFGKMKTEAREANIALAETGPAMEGGLLRGEGALNGFIARNSGKLRGLASILGMIGTQFLPSDNTGEEIANDTAAAAWLLGPEIGAPATVFAGGYDYLRSQEKRRQDLEQHTADENKQWVKQTPAQDLTQYALGAPSAPGSQQPPPGAAAPSAGNPLGDLLAGHHAGGGAISGRGPKGRDSVLIAAAPGEHMLTAGEVDKFGGHGAVHQLRAAIRSGAIRGYEPGGEITGDGSDSSYTPTGGTPGWGPAGQPGYYTVSDKKIRDLEDRRDRLEDRITELQLKQSELKADAKESERKRIQDQIDEDRKTLENIGQDIAAAEQGTFHAGSRSSTGRGRGQGTRSGAAHFGAQMPGNFGLDKGLPGLAEWAVDFLGNLAMAPIEGQLQAVMNAYGTESPSGFTGLLGLADFNANGGKGFFPSQAGSSARNSRSSSAGSTGWPSIAAPTSGRMQTGAPGAERWRGTVESIVDQYGPQLGITNKQAWTDALIRQIATESMGDPGADNPNDPNGRGGTQHVSGLLQFLPSTYAGSNISGLPYMDPTGQIAAALPYVLNRYGMNAAGAPNWIGQGKGFAKGGPGGTDTIPAWLTPGEHVLTTDDVKAMGGQGGVYAFRRALHRSTGGGINQGADIGWPAPFGPEDPDAPKHPGRNPTPGNDPHTIGLPDWTKPGTKFGEPPSDWWLKPINPDDILNPEWMPPGRRGEWLDRWGKKRWQLLGNTAPDDGGRLLYGDEKGGTNDSGPYPRDLPGWWKKGMEGDFRDPQSGKSRWDWLFPPNMRPDVGDEPWWLGPDMTPKAFGGAVGLAEGGDPDQSAPAPGSASFQIGNDATGKGINAGGGALGAAEAMGAAALNGLAPGAGVAAQIGMGELNRGIQYVGQLAGIGVEGILETFGLSDTVGDITKSPIGKIGKAIAGAHPSGGNTAGKTQGPLQNQQPNQPPAMPTDNPTRGQHYGSGAAAGASIGHQQNGGVHIGEMTVNQAQPGDDLNSQLAFASYTYSGGR